MAPRKATKAAVPPPPTSDRDKSPELGSPSKATKYNKQTGRPVRQSAGKVRRAAGYVDSSIIVGAVEGALDDEETSDTTESSDDSDSAMPTPLRNRRTAKAKRKRSPSPPSPSLQPIIYNQQVDDMTDDEAKQVATKTPPVTLQFVVPLGFHGPLSVKLDSSILKTSEAEVRHEIKRPKKKARKQSPNKELLTPSVRTNRTFTDLPPELRNKIYRHLFVRQRKFTIPQRSNMDGLSLSAQFLRVCKTAYNEGCSILYGENKFHFDRHHDVRAPFWDSKPKEIGYQDFLHFLKMIGPENLQYLRDIEIEFEDALPKNTPKVDSAERRYPGDQYLLNCLRILRDAKLRDISLKFFGRRQLWKGDTKFLGYLGQIKADSATNDCPHWYPAKMPVHVWVDVKEQMVRKKKLYQKKEQEEVSSP